MRARSSVVGIRYSEENGDRCGAPRPSRTPNTQDRTPGFTLIEMITLLIIIALMSSLAVPYYSRLRDRAEFEKSVALLEGELNDARHSAIQSGTDCVVRFDPQFDVFTISVEVPVAQQDSPAAMQDQDARIPAPRTVNLGENIGVQDFRPLINADSQSNTSTSGNRADVEMRFHEDGSSDGGSINLISRHGYAAQIIITPQTGAVTVQQDNDRQTQYPQR